jgi:hypothetical protein
MKYICSVWITTIFVITKAFIGSTKTEFIKTIESERIIKGASGTKKESLGIYRIFSQYELLLNNFNAKIY